MPDVFINYRREDAKQEADRLAENLEARFGKKHVFQDVDTIRPGDDWREEIDAALDSAHVVLALIGKDWLTVRHSSAHTRIEDPDDPVRLELEKGLSREDISVIPVLVAGAEMPTAAELPASLEKLSDKHAVELRPTTWRQDVDFLVKEVEHVVGNAKRPDRRIAREYRRISEPGKEARIFPNTENIDLRPLVTILVSYYRAEGMEVQTSKVSGHSVVIQARHVGKTRKALGVAAALMVMLERDKEELTVTVGASKWSKKIAGLGARRVGVYFLSPAVGASVMLAAVYGVWKQSVLPKKTFEIVEEYVTDPSRVLATM